MYKQKQLQCCGHRRRPKCSSRYDKSRKKNLQILQTYVVSPPKTSDNTTFELVERDKLEALKRKHGKQYLIINPKTKYLRNIKTEYQDPQYEYIEELKSLKSQIQNLQKQVQTKKAQQQYQDQYLSQIRNVKSEIQELKTIQRQMEQKQKQVQDQQDDYLDHIQSLKSQIKDLQQQVKQKKMPQVLPPIHIHPAINMNPEVLGISRKRNHPKKHSENHRRAFSINSYHNDELDQLRQEVQQLRRQMTLDKKITKNQRYLPKISRTNDIAQSYATGALKDFAKNNFSNKRLDTIYVSDPRQHDRKMSQSTRFNQWKKQVRQDGLRKVKKVVNVIYFVFNLKRIAQRIKMKRQNFFRDSFQQNIYSQVTLLKESFVKSTQDFVKMLPTSEQQLLIIVATDNQKQRQAKRYLARKYVNLFLDILRQTEFSPSVMQSLTQTCYFVCRHGSAGVLSNYFTSQELDIMCISKASLKVCSQKCLQKSQIISFIWIKLIVFNILLRTDSMKQLQLQNNPIWNTNFYLFGSIIYEISRKIQAQLIEKVPLNYIIGNWKHINFLNSKNSLSKKAINPSKSMQITLKPIEKTLLIEETPNELIQGTISRVFLSDAYDYESWDAQQRKIANYVNFIHRRICKYHAKLKQELCN